MALPFSGIVLVGWVFVAGLSLAAACRGYSLGAVHGLSQPTGRGIFPESESESEVTQSCPTLCDLMDSSLHQAPPSMGSHRVRHD